MKTMNGHWLTAVADAPSPMPTKEQIEEYIRAVMARYPKITLPAAYGAYACKNNKRKS